MSAPSYGARWPVYARQWDAMTILPARAPDVRATAVRLAAAKARYRAVEKLTGVPWFMIAVIHEREASQNWNTQLAQGDALHRVSTHVPRGMGPFATWEAVAVAALKHEGFDKIFDWRLEKILFHLEAYNGWGYYAHGVPSPYVWGATNIQRPGKYVADGVWSSRAVDQQLGCAALIKAMSELDASIQLFREEDDAPSSPFVPAKAGTQGPQNVALGSRLRGNERIESAPPAASSIPPWPSRWLQALRDCFSSLRNLVKKA
jgi:lysozyme family protein